MVLHNDIDILVLGISRQFRKAINGIGLPLFGNIAARKVYTYGMATHCRCGIYPFVMLFHGLVPFLFVRYGQIALAVYHYQYVLHSMLFGLGIASFHKFGHGL